MVLTASSTADLDAVVSPTCCKYRAKSASLTETQQSRHGPGPSSSTVQRHRDIDLWSKVPCWIAPLLAGKQPGFVALVADNLPGLPTHQCTIHL